MVNRVVDNEMFLNGKDGVCVCGGGLGGGRVWGVWGVCVLVCAI